MDYLLNSALPRNKAKEMISKLLALFEIAPVNRVVLEGALRSQMKDYEDAVLAEAAAACGCDMIVTRNLKDFKKSPLSAVDPAQFLAMLKNR